MRNAKRNFRRAFTLLEVMVVAVIVLLMLGMALPVFRAITGSRSEAGATNHITAMLNRARADAVGLQKTMGVAFIANPSTQVQYMAEVEFPDCPGWSNTTGYNVGNCVNYAPGDGASPYWYCTTAMAATAIPPAGGVNWQRVGGPPIELRVDTDVLPLPAGIGVQTICNCHFNAAGTMRVTDGYLSVGVILFDGQGRMTSQNYGICSLSVLGKNCQLIASYPSSINVYTGSSFGVASQFGLVIYQREALQSVKSSTGDALYIDSTPSPNGSTAALPDYTTGSPSQLTEENWLDQNATPLVLDRYTGTLIRAE